MSRTIAEVLAEHQQSTGHRDMKVHCWCGWSANRADGAFIAHQADALSAAGLGDVREAAAMALEGAADDSAVRSDTLHKTMQNMADTREYELADIVRYGAYSAEARSAAVRLRARAATVRGEG